VAILRTQFGQALTNIEVNGKKRQRAIDTHIEIQDTLSGDETLRSWGINSRLIGSYSRHTAIYPGKDVDVFGRLENLDTSASPRDVFERVEFVLVEEYGKASEGGRATPQARSIKVAFPDEQDENAAFAIDAVPAVQDGSRWAIPTKDRDRWTEQVGRWITTDPERFGELSSDLSTATWSPSVGGQNAYKPVVKLMRQARRVHLADRRPGGLYVEFAMYDVWNSRLIVGDEWDRLFAATLRHVGNRFGMAPILPLLDPGLGTAVDPALDVAEWTGARDEFLRLADLADEALTADDCAAAVKWREILGVNDRGQVFPLPSGCDSTGLPKPAVATAAITSPREARGFG